MSSIWTRGRDADGVDSVFMSDSEFVSDCVFMFVMYFMFTMYFMFIIYVNHILYLNMIVRTIRTNVRLYCTYGASVVYVPCAPRLRRP